MGKKVNFLGIEFNLIDDEAIMDALGSPDPRIYTVIRVADSDPHGGSPQLRARRTVIRCRGCRERCWFDPKSYDEVAILSPTILCLQCTTAMAEEIKAKMENNG